MVANLGRDPLVEALMIEKERAQGHISYCASIAGIETTLGQKILISMCLAWWRMETQILAAADSLCFSSEMMVFVARLEKSSAAFIP